MSRALDVNWPYWQKRRNENIEIDVPFSSYLLAPEMDRLIRDRTSLQHEFLFSTLWYTGAKISEVLALYKRNFRVDKFGIIVTFDQGRENREVMVSSRRYLSLVERVLKERRTSKSTGQGSGKEMVFTITRQTASSWLARRIETLKKPGQGGFVDFPVTFNTFRHSFAFNALLFGTPLEALQRWLGHNQAEMTRRYMAYFDDDDWVLIERIDFE